MPTVLVNSDVPQKIRSLSSLDPDYVDCVAVARSVTDRSPEEWARATVEGVSPWGRFIAWRVLCGLRLESGSSPEFIAGWKIADRGDIAGPVVGVSAGIEGRRSGERGSG